MLTTLGAALRRLGRAGPAARLEALARPVRDDFRRLLLPDGILAGFGYVHDAARLDYWVHPRDGQTGMRYSVLAMIHAILNDLLTPAEAGAHVAVIGEHLMGVDGVRLFDRPSEYHGGRMRRFQRAETSTFFGREIGLMYMHAHLRYAEAMAHYGDAEAFVGALRRAVPIALGDVVPGAARRQANCYYSSSDAIRECLLGLRCARTALTIDPVLPPALDGLRVEVEVAGRCLDVQYRCGARGVGPVRVTLNGSALPLTRLDNPYRSGGVVVPMRPIADALGRGGNELVVALG
jgi:cellobiose phosphorylase